MNYCLEICLQYDRRRSLCDSLSLNTWTFQYLKLGELSLTHRQYAAWLTEIDFVLPNYMSATDTWQNPWRLSGMRSSSFTVQWPCKTDWTSCLIPHFHIGDFFWKVMYKLPRKAVKSPSLGCFQDKTSQELTWSSAVDGFELEDPLQIPSSLHFCIIKTSPDNEIWHRYWWLGEMNASSGLRLLLYTVSSILITERYTCWSMLTRNKVFNSNKH